MRAIATAQAEVKSTTQQEEGAFKQVGLADRGISMLAEYEKNSRDALSAQAKASDAQAKTSEEDRRDKSALTLAQTKDKDAKAGFAVSGYDPLAAASNIKPEPADSENAASQISSVRSQYPVNSTQPNNQGGANFPPSNNNGLADLTNITNQIRSNATPNNSADLKNGVASPGADIVAKLDSLGEQLKAIASRPTSLTVTTASPVSDAAEIYSKLSKAAVASGGL